MEVTSQAPTSLKSILLSCPTELLVEVVKNLPCLDILRARKTCKHLYEITKSLEVWRHVVVQEPRQKLWLERPVDTYTSEELELLALRRVSVEIGYDNLVQGVRPHQHTISTIGRAVESTKLVPGGRWLFVATTRGGIFYYDLDDKECIPHPFIPDQSTLCKTAMAIDVDISSPYLKFNFAAGVTEQTLFHNAKTRVQVWEVTLLLDDHGRGIGLQGEYLATIEEVHRDGFFSRFMLSGRHYASIFFGTDDSMDLGFGPWKIVHDGERGYQQRIGDTGNRALSLLPNGRLFFLTKSRGSFYPPISEDLLVISNDDWNPIDCRPLVGVEEHSLSNPITHEGSFRFVVLARDILHGIIIDPQEPDLPKIQVVPIAPFLNVDPNRPLLLSDNFVLSWSSDDGLVLRRIMWKPDFTSPHVRLHPRERMHGPSRHFSTYHLDSASGRVVIQREKEILVQSFAFLSLPRAYKHWNVVGKPPRIFGKETR
ncbi:hypothetical protein BDN72DRAFT_583049 [Pluteus cervinus]|uniref:Uncharacterized protein n=1 Tax=Pluteus cervinus TaxID=181527 RepID=A0ACD3AV34_9AGAR|nr:hypothetical protein BDN72DRAFT_583049 [Pluteus cervinus]